VFIKSLLNITMSISSYQYFLIAIAAFR